MKLSKVKGVCAGSGCVQNVQIGTGLDIRSWIGDGAAMYPVRTLCISAETARRIWELEEDRVQCSDVGADTTLAMLLGSLPVQIDAEESPTKEICEINGWKVLWDEQTQHSLMINVRYLAPVDSKGRGYLYMVDEKLVAVYEDGVIAAVIVPMGWKDVLKEPMEQLGLIVAREKEHQ